MFAMNTLTFAAARIMFIEDQTRIPKMHAASNMLAAITVVRRGLEESFAGQFSYGFKR